MTAAQACVARRVITAAFVDSGARCLPAARVLVNQIKATDQVRWWRLKKKDLPAWARLLRIVLLLAPSSAAAERVFSIMRRSLGPQQDLAMGDIIRTSLMLQYNYRDHSSARASDRRARAEIEVNEL